MWKNTPVKRSSKDPFKVLGPHACLQVSFGKKRRANTQSMLLPTYRPRLHRASDVSQFGPLGNGACLADKICPWSQLSNLGQKAQPNRWNLTGLRPH